jgi:hypothetical protein
LIFYFEENFLLLVRKITFTDISTGSGRGELWEYAAHKIVSNDYVPFGLGYASYQEITIINWYLMLIFELGWPSITLLLAYLFFITIHILRSSLKPTDKEFYIFFLGTAFFMFNGSSVFYFPYAFFYAIIVTEFAHSVKRSHS